MKLKNILIVVKDIEKSKQFYHDLLASMNKRKKQRAEAESRF